MNGLCAISPAPARGRSEAACTERVEDVKSKGVFLGGEVEDPKDVDDGEDEPACGHGTKGSDAGENALVDADDCEGDCD